MSPLLSKSNTFRDMKHTRNATLGFSRKKTLKDSGVIKIDENYRHMRVVQGL